MKKMKLSECVENPDNPSKASDADFKALIEKLRRNPNGLKADRIAMASSILTRCSSSTRRTS